jgi:spore maturation protein SpmA
MALSRFWTIMLLGSILYIFTLTINGNIYQVGYILNGKQGDPLLKADIDTGSLPKYTQIRLDTVISAGKKGFTADGFNYIYQETGCIEIYEGSQPADGLFPTCKNTMMDLWLPLIGYLTFFCGLLHILSQSGAIEKLAGMLSPFFRRIFPSLPAEHPAYGYMTLNFAANFLGLDNAATPFGLKAMESMQETNPDKTKASDAQIMFLCLHAAGLTLIPTSIIGYRAAQHAANPADIMIPTIITSFIGTLAALLFVSIRQKVNLLNLPVMVFTGVISLLIAWMMYFIGSLDIAAKLHITGNLSNGLLLGIIFLIVLYAFLKERFFKAAETTIFDSFVTGAKEGFTTGLRVLPYMIGMLAVLSIFRNSGLMDLVMQGLTTLMGLFGMDQEIIHSLPVALMRPFSAGGSRGFMLDAMKTYGADSLAGRLSCLFQGAAETTFYVVALYFGSVGVKNARYTIGIMLLTDLVCVIAGTTVCIWYF